MKRTLSVFCLFAIIASGLCQVYAEAPEWWQPRGVLTGGVANDYAPANQGQLKSLATKAYEQLAQQFPGSENDVIHDVVRNFSKTQNNYSSVNLGQLKAVAQPFYDRLIQLGLTNAYPWASATTPADDYAMANIGQVKYLFSFSLVNPIEDKWFYHTDNVVPGGNFETIGSGESASMTLISSALRDGGFEASEHNGSFPNSGNWSSAAAPGGAGAVCTTTSRRSGQNGLWEYTGSSSASWWSSPYQQFSASPGDTFDCQAYVRQTSSWVPGSRGYVRIVYLDARANAIQNGVHNSSGVVSSRGLGWTQCAVPRTASAPAGTAYVRMELRVQKPVSASGVCVMNFDDCLFRKRGNLNSAWAGEGGATPEGSTCFLSSVIDQSGWRAAYNQALDLSDYASGYLKFWLKSTGRVRVGVADSIGRTFSQVVAAKAGWTEITIPVSSFGSVDLRAIGRPFTIQSEEGNPSRFLVDAVRWTMEP